MKKFIAILLLFTIVFSTSFLFNQEVHAVSYLDLAANWAPLVYHDINASFDTGTDWLLKFNYDGDWAGNNNWENLLIYPKYAHVYYEVHETATHYFIGYHFFHARDDGTLIVDKHENDLESSLVVIKKDGTTYGSFHLLETNAHYNWYQYTNDPNITTGNDNIDGGVLFSGTHPKIFIESGGHGVYAYDGSDAPGGDGIVFEYTGIAEEPQDQTGNYVNVYGYNLVSIDELWDRRNDTGGAGHTFESFGVFDGDTYGEDSCKAPWGFDDYDDGPVYIGQGFSDPAYMVDEHLNGLGTFSHDYIFNPYYSHKIVIQDVTSKSNRDSLGGKSDIFVRVWVGGDDFVDNRMWKYDDAPIDNTRTVFWGRDDADSGDQYSTDFNFIYIAKPQNSEVIVEIYDHDSTSDHDFMGSVTANPAPLETVTWLNAQTSNGEALISASIYAK